MKVLRQALLVAAAFALFVLGLEMLKRGAGGIMPALRSFHLEGILNTFGLGWIMAYCVLSGSPVAAVALTLFGARQMTDVETLGMIAGSRFGASFVVLLLGTIYYFRQRRAMATVATGVLCLLVTWTIYIPATFIGYVLLVTDVLAGFRLVAPESIGGVVDALWGPIVDSLAAVLHQAALFGLGVFTLVASFSLFDRALPDLKPQHSRFRQIAFVVYRPWVMFILGVGVTCLTLSVSVSLGLLVPLSAKGYVRRENIIPYIMGANISTFLDTLAVSLLVGEPRALSVVLAEMLGVSLISLAILLGFYASYRDGLEWCLEMVTRNRRTFLLFVGIIMIVPAVLMLV